MKVFASILILLLSFTQSKSEAGMVSHKFFKFLPASIIFNDIIVAHISSDNSSSKEDRLTSPVKEIRQLNLLKFIPSPQGIVRNETAYNLEKPTPIPRVTCCQPIGLLLVFPQHYFW